MISLSHVFIAFASYVYELFIVRRHNCV